MSSKHACGFGLQIHPCASAPCTLRNLADMLCMLAETFEDAYGGSCNDKYVLAITATRMAHIIGEIREQVWCYERDADMWHDNLCLLDLTADVLASQYRHAALPVLNLNGVATSGLSCMLRIVERNLREMAGQRQAEIED